VPTTLREELPFSCRDSIGDRIPEMAIAAGSSAAGAVSPSRVRFAVACDTYQAVILKPAAAARKRRPGSLDRLPFAATSSVNARRLRVSVQLGQIDPGRKVERNGTYFAIEPNPSKRDDRATR
jgi:hypothetical protein